MVEDSAASGESTAVTESHPDAVAEMRRCACEGVVCDLSAWPETSRGVSPAVIQDLCAGGQDSVHPNGVRLRGAVVVGTLEFKVAALRVPLQLDECTLGAVDLSWARAPAISFTNCHIAWLSVRGAVIDVMLSLAGTSVGGADLDGYSLNANGLRLAGDALLDDGFKAEGAVSLEGATVGGKLAMVAARLNGAKDGYSLLAEGLHVCGDFDMAMKENAPFTTVGAVQLTGAVIDGQLSMIGAKLNGVDKHGYSLAADGLHVGTRDMVLEKGFETKGGVRLTGAVIDGQLSMKGAKLRGADKDGYSLVSGGLHVGEIAFLTEGFETHGGVWFVTAMVDGQLIMKGAEIGAARNGCSLDASGLRVGMAAFLDEGFEAKGGVRLTGATIDGYLFMTSAKRLGTLELRSCTVGRFYGVFEPTAVKWIRLRGFALTAVEKGWKDQHKAWVSRQEFGADWSPDPYEQLAAYYTRAGDQHSARRIRIARHSDELRHRRKINRWTSLPYRAGQRSLGILVGYGYRRWPAGALLAISIAVAGYTFLRAEDSGAMTPDHIATQDSGVPRCGEAYPCFNSWVYGADVVLPIIDFGQDSTWRPNDQASGGELFVWARWIFIAIGWALASVFVAAFTSLVQRG